MRSRIAVTATLPVPYRVLRLASAMTAGVDCRCFVVPCCSGCRFFLSVPSPARNPFVHIGYAELKVRAIGYAELKVRGKKYSFRAPRGILFVYIRVIRGKKYSFRAPRGTICCLVLFMLSFSSFVPSPARNHLLSFYSSVSPLRKLFPLPSLIIRIKNLIYTIICALVCIITA